MNDHNWEIRHHLSEKNINNDSHWASCSCGWASRGYRQMAMANVAGVNHVETAHFIESKNVTPEMLVKSMRDLYEGVGAWLQSYDHDNENDDDTIGLTINGDGLVLEVQDNRLRPPRRVISAGRQNESES